MFLRAIEMAPLKVKIGVNTHEKNAAQTAFFLCKHGNDCVNIVI